jgi:hypothetical protein
MSSLPIVENYVQRNIPEDTILHSHRRENLKSSTDSVHWPESAIWAPTVTAPSNL